MAIPDIEFPTNLISAERPTPPNPLLRLEYERMGAAGPIRAEPAAVHFETSNCCHFNVASASDLQSHFYAPLRTVIGSLRKSPDQVSHGCCRNILVTNVLTAFVTVPLICSLSV